jgi:hypothetical protein
VFNILKTLLLVLFFSNGFAQDPMKPPSRSTGNQSDRIVTREVLNLQQILSSKSRRVAIINDTLVIEGQVIGGAKVTEITDQWVKVSYKGRSTTLTMTVTTKEYNREK